MNVSSVKNLNGEVFSAIQDASLTNVVSSNSANWNEISAYQANSGDYLTTADSANFYTTANESGFITGVDLTPYQLTADMTAYQPVGDYLTAVPESALSGFIPYSASGIELPNSNFKIDVSGQAYKVSSYNETETIIGNYGGDYETWFPLSSLERRVYSSTLPPGDFDCGSFMVYPNHGGMEFYIPLNGIVDLTQIPQENWDTSTILSIQAANNVEAILSYSDTNNVEIPYLTEVPAGTMNESAFSYDASDNITAYNGSAFKAGDEFPQSATEAIETVTANSADWNGTTETVNTNSGAWGGSALPISAGPGIKFEMVDNTLVASTDETLLYSTSAPADTINLSEASTGFEKLKLELSSYQSREIVNYIEVKPNASYLTYFANALIPAATYPLQIAGIQFTANNAKDYTMTTGVRMCYKVNETYGDQYTTIATTNIRDVGFITKIWGINRK